MYLGSRSQGAAVLSWIRSLVLIVGEPGSTTSAAGGASPCPVAWFFCSSSLSLCVFCESIGTAPIAESSTIAINLSNNLGPMIPQSQAAQGRPANWVLHLAYLSFE